MDYPVKISQSWKAKGWSADKRKWELTPTVSVKQTHFDRMKPVGRKVWFEMICNGIMPVTYSLRKWLDENGFEDIKSK